MKTQKVLFLLILFAFSLNIYGQEKGISGIVRDQNDAGISGASVVLRNTETGLERIISTEVDGRFVFPPISESRYEIIVQASGFKRLTQTLDNKQDITLTLEILPLQAETTIYSGSRQEELRESLNTKVEVITRQQIEDSGYETVGEILKEVPGVVTRRGSESGSSSGAAGEQIQGVGSRQTLVLLDGFPVINARGIKSGNINLDRQSTARLEQIEVVKGAASALYGSDSIGGVINLITREPRKPLDGSVTISGGSYGIFDTKGDVGFKKNHFSGFISAERHKNNGFDLTPTTWDTTGAGFHRYDFFTKLKYQFSPTLSVSSFADVKQGNILGRSIGERGNQAENVDESNQSYGATASWNFNSRGLAQVRGYYSRYDEIVEQTLQNGTRVPDENLFQRFGRIDANVSYVWGERQLIQFGGEWATDRYRGINRLRNDAGERADTKVAWAQDKVNLTNWATLTLGLRFDDHSVFGSAYSPKIGLNIRAIERLNLRASWGRGFRAPDLGQLYFKFFNPTNLYQVIGNPNLRPEHSGSWQIGAEYASTKKTYRFGVNFFRNDVRNLIEAKNFGFVRSSAQVNGIFSSLGLTSGEFNPVLNRLLFIYVNQANIYTQGIEADFDYFLPRNFAVSGAYTYLDARDKLTDKYLTERSKHQAFLKLGYDNPGIGLRANVRANLAGRYETSTITNRGVTVPAFVPTYTTVDIYAAKSFKKRFEIFGLIGNAFNERDANVGRFDERNQPFLIYRNDVGRILKIGLKYSFSKN